MMMETSSHGEKRRECHRFDDARDERQQDTRFLASTSPDRGLCNNSGAFGILLMGHTCSTMQVLLSRGSFAIHPLASHRFYSRRQYRVSNDLTSHAFVLPAEHGPHQFRGESSVEQLELHVCSSSLHGEVVGPPSLQAGGCLNTCCHEKS